jgi:hypothetical protein
MEGGTTVSFPSSAHLWQLMAALPPSERPDITMELSGDDYNPEALRRMAAALLAHPEVVAATIHTRRNR